MDKPIIEFKKVSKFYEKGKIKKQRHTVFEKISFVVKRHEICGLYGSSGCGKSTTLRIFMELVEHNGGEIFYNGKLLSEYTFAQKKEIHKDVQIVFQDPSDAFHPKWKIRQSLMEPLKIYNCYEDVAFKKDVQQYFKLLGLESSFLDRYPYQLSGGQIQRLAFVRVLLLKPRCIFLDEATSMLDVSVQAQFMSIVKKLNEVLGTTFVIISHDRELILTMCDRIYMFEEGKLALIENNKW